MSTKLEFVLNGEMRRLETEGRRSLLEVLREDFDLTGTKYGCGEGQCRSCTVLLDGAAVPSCLTPVESVAGRQVRTIEGLAGEEGLHPVQEAFIAEEAMQCGYCVPGMILTTVALLREHPRPDRETIVRALNGNLCRCCNYPNLLKAVERAAGRTREEGKV
jgi:aerobic-type carbon monoxide dehydrogenase small subunit (CoxS/CutS family)